MKANEYQELAMRTNDGMAKDRLIKSLDNKDIDIAGVLNASLGLSGEVGELNDMIKKHIYHEKPLDEEHLRREIGDICWYIALMCESLGYTWDRILQLNISKLKTRYPKGFDVNKANNRTENDV